MTESDKFIARRSTLPTSLSETARCEWGETLWATGMATVATLTARLETAEAKGSAAQIAFAEETHAAATRDMERLRRMIDGAAKQIPALQAVEAAATETLGVKKADANRKRVACLALFREKYTAAIATLVELLRVERDTLETSAGFFRVHQAAPELARAAVSTDLIPFVMFVPGSGASTLGESVSILPALADPDSPDVRAPRHWPPMPPAPPQAPLAPVRKSPEPPYVKRGRTVEFTVHHPHGPFADDADDLMPFRAATAAD